MDIKSIISNQDGQPPPDRTGRSMTAVYGDFPSRQEIFPGAFDCSQQNGNWQPYQKLAVLDPHPFSYPTIPPPPPVQSSIQQLPSLAHMMSSPSDRMDSSSSSYADDDGNRCYHSFQTGAAGMLPIPYYQSTYEPDIPTRTHLGPVPFTVVESSRRVASTPPKRSGRQWSQKHDQLLIDSRATGMKWDDIAKIIPDKSGIACRLRYQNYVLKGKTEAKMPKGKQVANAYMRFRNEMYQGMARELGMPWQRVEAQLFGMDLGQIAQAADVLPHEWLLDLGDE